MAALTWVRTRSGGELSPWRLLMLDFSAWVFTGGVATAWNALRYRFPVESGLKIVVGCLTLGILVSTYLALEAEERLIIKNQERTAEREEDQAGYMSLSTKFLIFIGAALALFSVVMLLLVFKDIDYVQANPGVPRKRILREIGTEIAFVLGLLLAGCFALARQYARNLRRMFGLLETAFDHVEQGKLTTRVPIVSNDEVSLIARHTNRMIAGLRDRERIKVIFGKYLSPTVADAILKSEKESELGGREVRVAILFTDIRNYTALSEALSPGEVVEFLNFYFTKIVEVIHGAGGVLDKFIGDAAMAVFGVDGSPDAASDCVRAGMAIRGLLGQVNDHLRRQGHPEIDNGVGIHFGTVIAGNIGSSQRFEYTVIGDAVNTASRIEALCKTERSKLLISSETHAAISVELRSQFVALGEFELKGKAKPVLIYGTER